MRVLITGAAGFVGGYCIDHFRDVLGWDVYATKLKNESISSGCHVTNLDLLDRESIESALKCSRPDYILHLAAQSSVALSWKDPALTADINIKGTINLLEETRRLDTPPKILLVGSSEEYGWLPEGISVVGEDTAPNPGNIYAVSKAAQNMIGNVYARAYNMNICMTRAFNHIGRGQSPVFAASDFCRQAARIEKGLQEPVIRVGNLAAKRDFTDVRDVAAAYARVLEDGKSGKTYNVGSGKAIAISEILEKIINLTNAQIRVEKDPGKMRPLDVPVVEADITAITNDTGWRAERRLDDTLKEMIDYWRETEGE